MENRIMKMAIRRLAKCVLNVCDFMDGYMGKQIEKVAVAFALEFPVFVAMMYLMIRFC